MPNRIIRESIKTSPEIDALSWFEEVLYYRLIVTADDYGCLDGRIVLLKNELFPLKEKVTKKMVEDAIGHLISLGLLCRYEVNGMPYLHFPTWEKYQRLRNKHRKFPEPVDDMAVTCQSNDGQTAASCQPEYEVEVEEEVEVEYEDEARGRAREGFTPPTPKEVEEYVKEKGYAVPAQRFCSYYKKRKWKGVDNWREKVDEWAENEIDDKAKPVKDSSFDTDDFFEAAQRRAYSDTELVGDLKKLVGVTA